MTGTNNPNAEVTLYSTLTTNSFKVWVTQVRDFRGNVIETDEDMMNRTAAIKYPQILRAGATNVVRTARTESYLYTNNLLTQVALTDPTGVTNYRTTYFKYDALNRRRQKDTPEGVLTWQYDAAGSQTNVAGYRRSAVSVNAEAPANAVADVSLAYGYDSMARLSTVLDAKYSTSTSVATYGYDAVGNLGTLSLGNGVSQNYTYTPQNRLTQEDVKLSGSTLRSYQYQLGPTGNRTYVNELANGSVRRQVYWTYDGSGLANLFRLTQERITNGASGVTTGIEAYSYTQTGNRTNLAVTSGLGSGLPSSGTWIYNANAAMRAGLEKIGLASDEVDALSKLAAESRQYYHYFDGPGGQPPEVPGKLPGF